MTMQEFDKEFWPLMRNAAENTAREALAGKPFWAWPELTADTPPDERMEKAEQVVRQLIDRGLDIQNSEIVRITLVDTVNSMMAGWQVGARKRSCPQK